MFSLTYSSVLLQQYFLEKKNSVFLIKNQHQSNFSKTNRAIAITCTGSKTVRHNIARHDVTPHVTRQKLKRLRMHAPPAPARPHTASAPRRTLLLPYLFARCCRACRASLPTTAALAHEGRHIVRTAAPEGMTTSSVCPNFPRLLMEHLQHVAFAITNI